MGRTGSLSFYQWWPIPVPRALRRQVYPTFSLWPVLLCYFVVPSRYQSSRCQVLPADILIKRKRYAWRKFSVVCLVQFRISLVWNSEWKENWERATERNKWDYLIVSTSITVDDAWAGCRGAMTIGQWRNREGASRNQNAKVSHSGTQEIMELDSSSRQGQQYRIEKRTRWQNMYRGRQRWRRAKKLAEDLATAEMVQTCWEELEGILK